MSQDNVLKKEFNKKDVQRVRNVMTGKAGDRTTEGIGYTKKQEFRQEGDIWTENGREWTIKEGIRQNVTKLDKAKEALMPMFCPSCNKIMNHKHDQMFWNNHRKCYNCLIEFEQELRIKGLWEEYEKQIHNTDIDNFIKDYQVWVEDMLTTSNQGFVTEAGDVENWKGGINKGLARQSTTEVVEYLQSLKK